MINATTLNKATSMDPESNGELGVFIPGWPYHVEIKVVFGNLIGPLVALGN